ncbi:hypothetical protein HYC85_000299 [Camellia sinensis]|uniref:Uncharacterized protein n=1 Tax=Camellia sinensis TaxID=4442 RepID=A0A7J7I229_CAMSI|nr:hypothetical protein HYC85_000299 [Camellia sinensis]
MLLQQLSWIHSYCHCGNYYSASSEESGIHFFSAPLHEMQQYYRLGGLDNCSGKWNALVDCLTLKTKRTSVVEDVRSSLSSGKNGFILVDPISEILETREKAKPHIWSFRTPEEAASHWKELFGNLDEVE